MAFKTHLERLQVAKKAHQNANQELAHELAQTLGAALPAGASLKWDQHTPYFNDGDPCTFGVHTPSVHPYQVELANWGLDHLGKIALAGTHPSVSVELVVQIRELQRLFDWVSTDTLRAAFGDHARVTVRADGSFALEANSKHD